MSEGWASVERLPGVGIVAAQPRSVMVVSGDSALRARLRNLLAGLRWSVREASGGADALVQLEEAGAEALLFDSWLPDLQADEFLRCAREKNGAMDMLSIDGGDAGDSVRSPRRNELLHAIRQAQIDAATARVNSHAVEVPGRHLLQDNAAWESAAIVVPRGRLAWSETKSEIKEPCTAKAMVERSSDFLPELVGQSAAMMEMIHLIRLVAPRKTTVLIEGETGTGKELVAAALHRLSPRVQKPFMVLNCAAIPEALLEAELFGHTRGAFTGATHSRTGRIEAADGGTLFLDEIGEMPLGLQAKMLRFLECGELQRVGENEPVRVNVRVIAATHQPIAQRAAEGSFRADLYYRLAVFPLKVPSLAERREDIPLLVEHFMRRLGEEAPVKRLSAGALARLMPHAWPGNVRELGHVLERASILAGESPEISGDDVRFGAVR